MLNSTPFLASSSDPWSRYPFSDFLMGFSQWVMLMSLIVKPSCIRFLLFFPVLLSNLYLIIRTTTRIPAKDNIMGSILATHLLMASDYILLTNPQVELKLQDEKSHIAKDPTRANSLRARIKWGIMLFATARGIGWEHEPTKSLRTKPTSSRWKFVVVQLFWTFFYILLYDISGLYREWAKENVNLSARMIQGEKVTALAYIFWRSMHLAMFVTTSVTHMSISFAASSAFVVGVGVTQPRDWPHAFGYWSEGYTIRNFWGKVWHQLLRRPLATHCKAISHSLLRIPRGTLLSSYIQLFLAWSISGLVHGTGEYMATRTWPITTLKFFLLQSLGITLESLLMAVWRMSGLPKGPRVMGKWVGYVWVWAWFLWVLDPEMSERMLDHGMHFSVLKGLKMGDWFLV